MDSLSRQDGVPEEALASLLRRRPDALVAALNPEGVRIRMPDSVPLMGQRIAGIYAGTDLAAPRDLSRLIDAWEQAKSRGGAQLDLVLKDATRAQVTIIDVLGSHGCFVIIAAPLHGSPVPEDLDTVISGARRTTVCRVRKDELSLIVEVDDAATEMYGLPRDQLVGRLSREFTHPDDLALSVDAWMRMVATPGSTVRSRIRQIRSDGTPIWVDIMNHNRLEDPDYRCILSDVVDVSEEVAAQAELEERERLLRKVTEELAARERLLHRVMETMPSGLLHVDVGQLVVHANDRLFDILDARPCREAADLFERVVEEDRPFVLDALRLACDEGVDRDLEVRITPVSSTAHRVCGLAIRALIGDDGVVAGAVVSAADLTESARRRAELEMKASVDPLTGCYNRDSIMAALEGAVSGEVPSGTAVIFIDLDGFKAINDRLGHAAGDELLRVTADRLHAAVRTGDLVGRIGGDEFLVVCPDMPHPDLARAIAPRLRDGLCEPVVMSGELIAPSASVGVAWVDGVADPSALVAAADAAMYRAKRENLAMPVIVEVAG